MKAPRLATTAAAAMATAATTVAAQGELCSCAPASYTFRLDFAGSCASSSGFGPPGDGVEGSVCFYTQGGSPDDVDEDVQFGGGPGRERERRLRRRGIARYEKAAGVGERRLPSSAGPEANDEDDVRMLLEKADLSSHVEHARRHRERRRAQYRQYDTTPVVVTSVTFLEADRSPDLNIVNQNSTYFNVTLEDGALLTYPSISAGLDPDVPLEEQTDLLPGGVMLILFGVNAEDTVVRNTVAWGYETDYCAGQPLEVGDSIGWATLEDFVPPDATFCPAVPTPSPTPSPTEGSTTEAPVVATAAPTPSPTVSPTEGSATEAPTAAATEATEWSAPPTSQGKGKGKGKSPKVAKAKSAKSAGLDAKAHKAGEDMSAPPSAKATKLFKSKASSKGAKSSSADDGAAQPVGMFGKSAKSGSGGTGVSKSAKGLGTSGVPSAKSTEGSGPVDAKAGKAVEDVMSAPLGAAVDSSSAKAAKVMASAKAAKLADAKAGKGGGAKSSKVAGPGMSMLPKGKGGSAKSEKKGGYVVDAKAHKAGDGPAESVPEAPGGVGAPSAKASKVDAKAVKAKAPKASSDGDVVSAKAVKTADAKAMKAKPSGAGMSTPTTNIFGGKSAKAVSAKSSKAVGDGNGGGKGAAKAEKEIGDAKAGKEGASSAKAEKHALLLSSKALKAAGMSVPGGEGKGKGGSSSKGGKMAKSVGSAKSVKSSKSSKGAKATQPSTGFPAAQDAGAWGGPAKPDTISTGNGYREVVDGLPQ